MTLCVMAGEQGRRCRSSQKFLVAQELRRKKAAVVMAANLRACNRLTDPSTLHHIILST
jgi:hypothetical protein